MAETHVGVAQHRLAEGQRHVQQLHIVVAEQRRYPGDRPVRHQLPAHRLPVRRHVAQRVHGLKQESENFSYENLKNTVKSMSK